MLPFLIIVCGVCQILATTFSTLEMFWSEYKHHTRFQVFQDPSGFALSDFGELYLAMKYVGVMFHVFATYFLLKFVRNLHTFNSVRTLWAESAGIFTTQLVGFVALCVRLVVLFLYSLDTVCRQDRIPSFESYHIMLGVAAVFGFLALLSNIAYIIAYMYQKLVKIEACKKNIFFIV